MEELLLLINYVSDTRKKFNHFFNLYMKIFLSGEKVKGGMVPSAEGSIKGEQPADRPLALRLREGALLFLGGSSHYRGLLNNTTPE